MLDQLRHHWNVGSRREFFTRAGSGLAAMALAAMVEEEKAKAAVSDPLAAKQPHHAPTARSVIFLFMEGGPSHVDLFDYKPALINMDGQPIPDSIGKPKLTAQGTQNNTLMAPKRVWKQRGQSGMWVSDWYEHTGAFVDEMTIVRSCWTDGINHVGSVCEMNTGSILAGRPSLGAWSTYGLGTANKNLPTFVVMTDDKDPLGGANNWSSGFLPTVYQGTQFRRRRFPTSRSATNWVCSVPSMKSGRATSRTIRNSTPGFARTSWRIRCSRPGPRRLIYPGKRRRRGTCTDSTTRRPRSMAATA
jgi:hypothetical protein